MLDDSLAIDALPDDGLPADENHRLRWRERSLRDTRRRLHQLQIEVHRVKADLARLESANETAIADELASDLHIERHASAAIAPASTSTTQAKTASPRTAAKRVQFGPQPHKQPDIRTPANAPATPLQTSRRATPPRAARRRKKAMPAWVVSVGIHGLALLLLMPLSYVILTNEHTPLFASMFGPEEFAVEDPGNAPIELVSYEEFEAPGDAIESVANLPEMNTDDFGPLDDELTSAASNSVGQLNALPTDVGTLMAGGGAGTGPRLGGSGGRGAAGDEARLGEMNFFGTPARANRVVFLVDNSGSMKQGRMETTLLELARCIEALGEKQEFYVVFYSDQAYPMFYPASEMQAVAATRENKQRFYQWLQTIELCVGGALLKAVEIAESLEPQVVYVLSDGNITSVRTLTELTRPGARKFTLHTLGMGVAKPQDAQNLAAIAAAHRGTFQMVRPLPAAMQMAKTRPLRSNTFGVAWGAGSLQPTR